MKWLNASAILVTLWAVPLQGTARTFTFGEKSKFTNIAFESKMDLEDILGTTHKLTGTAKWLDNKGEFQFSVPVDSLRTGIDMRDQHLRSEMWLNAKKFPTITYEGKIVTPIGADRYRVEGVFTMHGVSRQKTIEVQVREIPRTVAKKAMMGDANWIRVRGQFTVKLSDFGVKVPSMVAGKVNDSWVVKLSLFGREGK